MRLEDLPGAERWLSAAARDTPRGTRRPPAGARRARRQAPLPALVTARCSPAPNRSTDHWIEGRLRERRLQLGPDRRRRRRRLARSDQGDQGRHGGSSRRADGSLLLARGPRPDFLKTQPSTRARSSPARTIKLFVRVADGRPDWQALAHVVRDEILPASGRGSR